LARWRVGRRDIRLARTAAGFGIDDAVFKDGAVAAEDKIHVAINVAVSVVLQHVAVGQQRILVADGLLEGSTTFSV
jgi:hypothetical protein